MQPNAIKSLLKSRKFLLAMLDALVASIALTLTWFLSPDKVASVLALIGIWQPVCIAVIISIAAEDVANAKERSDKYTADQKVVEAKIYDAAGPIIPVVPAVPCEEPKG